MYLSRLPYTKAPKDFMKRLAALSAWNLQQRTSQVSLITLRAPVGAENP